MDALVENLVALGVPGLVLLIAIGLSGLSGGAAIVAALAFLGGPFGMLGGIAMLGLMGLISRSVASYGLEAIAVRVVQGLYERGESRESILETIEGYPLTRAMNRNIVDYLDSL